MDKCKVRLHKEWIPYWKFIDITKREILPSQERILRELEKSRTFKQLEHNSQTKIENETQTR